MAEESRRISSGDGVAEWAALLAETRKEAAEARETDVRARLRRKLQQQQQQQQEASHLNPRTFLGALGAYFA